MRGRIGQEAGWLLRACALCAFCLAGHAHADQYRSQAREVSPPSASGQKSDPQALLKSTHDPYARSMLLREIAADAAARKDYKTAARMLEEAIRLKALSGPVIEKMKQDLAALTLANGDFKSQIPQLQAMVRSGTASPEVLVALGVAYVQTSRFSDAVPLLQRGIAASPHPDISWKRALAAALIGSKQYAPAAGLLEELLDADPTQADAWLQLSALYLKAKDMSRAQATMAVATRLGYLVDAGDRLRLIALTARIGAPFEAASTLRGWMDSGALPRSYANQQLLSSLWVQARETSLAIAALEKLVAQKPQAEAYRTLGQLYMERQDYARAAGSIERALQLGGASGDLQLTLGLARYQLADIDGAKEAFDAARAFPKQKALAEDWIKYLDSGLAREQALAAAQAAAAEPQQQVSLSTALLGGSVKLGRPDTEVSAADAGQGATPGGGGSTPVGAVRGGSADGMIPAWSGGITPAQVPAGFRTGDRLLDPFAGEKPLFTITAGNMAKYSDRLTDGYRALLARDPGYRMPVYPSHRSVAYPQAIYDATQANRTRARLVDADTLAGARLGFPFPDPKSGVEVMWNHRLRYRGDSSEVVSRQIVMGANGKPSLNARRTETTLFRYGNIKDPIDLSKSGDLLYYLLRFNGPGVDNLVVDVHESARGGDNARVIYVGPPGIPRLVRIPPVGYDQPFPATDNMYYVDMVDMYNGAFDRYDWKLLGRREFFVPYNAYRLSDGSRHIRDLLKPHFLDPSAARYELHRVWVIEASLRQGEHHKFGKRVFYVDEDSWNVLLVENYDQSGKLWRFQEGHLLPRYDVKSANCYPVVTYDLKDGRYFAARLLSEDPPPQFDVKLKVSDFNPGTVTIRYLH